jgi:hypothetical protein
VIHALAYLLLRYRLWRHKPRYSVSYEPDARSTANTPRGAEWWRVYPDLEAKKDGAE